MVDLPSRGSAEVMPITLLDAPGTLRSTASLIDRIELGEARVGHFRRAPVDPRAARDRPLTDGRAGLQEFTRELLRRDLVQHRHHGQAGHLQLALHLLRGPENPFHHLAEEADSGAERQSSQQAEGKDQYAFRLALALGRRCGRNQARFGEGEQFLLNRTHIALKKVFVEAAVALRLGIELPQGCLRHVGRPGPRNSLRQLLLEPLLALFDGLVVVPARLGQPADLVQNGRAHFAHPRPQVHHRLVIVAEAGVEILFPARIFQVLLAQGVDDRVAHRIRNRRIEVRVPRDGFEIFRMKDTLEGVQSCQRIQRLGASGDHAAAQLGDLLLVEQLAVQRDDIVIRPVGADVAFRRQRLLAEIAKPPLQPRRRSPASVDLHFELVGDVRLGDRVRDLSGPQGVGGVVIDLDDVAEADAGGRHPALQSRDEIVGFRRRRGLRSETEEFPGETDQPGQRLRRRVEIRILGEFQAIDDGAQDTLRFQQLQLIFDFANVERSIHQNRIPADRNGSWSPQAEASPARYRSAG